MGTPELRLEEEGGILPLEPGKPRAVTLRGGVVEIVERGGRRLARIVVDPQPILEVAAACLEEAHLGDRIVIDASVTIQSVEPETGHGHLRPGRESEP